MVKRKMKKAIKQKQKQNVNVKQNVKVVIGDIKKKRAVKSSGAKSGAGSKPPIILNISQPQPYNNPYMEYFKQQLQNQEPVKANTLAQQEKINERQETKASKAGALHSLDQDPGKDQERELRRQAAEQRARTKQAEADKKAADEVISESIKKLPKAPKQPKARLELVESIPQRAIAESIASNLEQQQRQMENRMINPFQEMEEEETRLEFPNPATSPSLNLPPPKAIKLGGAGAEEEKSEPSAKKKPGRPKGSVNKTEEEKEAEKNKPKRKVGRPSKAEKEALAAEQAEKIRQARTQVMSPKFPTII